MAYAMTKQGSLDNCITYEFMCDTISDMNAIENRYRTIGTVAIVLSGESGMEVYIAGSDKQWNSLSSISSGTTGDTAGLVIHICAQNEVSNGLPDVELPDETTIYLVPASDASSGNLYDEYIYVDDEWELFGGVNIDLSNYVQKTDIATQNAAGLVKVLDNGNVTFNEHNQLVLTLAGTAVVKSGQSDHPISVTHQHEAAFYGLAKAAGQDMKNSNNTVGTYTDDAKNAIRTMIGAGTYTKPNDGIPAADLASGVLPDMSLYATKANPTFTGNISSGRLSDTTIGLNSIAVGENVTASSVYTHAEGGNTIASGAYAHAEGYGTSYTKNGITYTSEASGMSSHAEGLQTIAGPGTAAHAEGNQTQATGVSSHAEGDNTVANGFSTHAEGNSSIASGSISHVEGYGTKATANIAHAEGNATTASGAVSHAEGDSTTASGPMSHAEGDHTTAEGSTSHAEGAYTTAVATYSHVSGKYNVLDNYNNWPTWTANTSYDINDRVKRTNTSNGKTITTGYICKITNNDSTFQSNKWYNHGQLMNYVEIIGNGETNNTRSNARALDWDGNEYLMGDLYVHCNNDSTGGTKVATEATVATLTARMVELETQISSLRQALNNLIPAVQITDESGNTVTDENGNVIVGDN